MQGKLQLLMVREKKQFTSVTLCLLPKSMAKAFFEFVCKEWLENAVTKFSKL